ncbi:hypothetical protein M378DRAFT_44527, partial [Amanita muscaria Koide BX008]
LISIGRIDDAGYYATFGGGQCVIADPSGGQVGIVPKISLRDLHIRMGHITPKAVRDLVRRGTIVGVELTDVDEDFECEACILAKMKRALVPKERRGERAKTYGEEVHSDLWGPA